MSKLVYIHLSRMKAGPEANSVLYPTDIATSLGHLADWPIHVTNCSTDFL